MRLFWIAIALVFSITAKANVPLIEAVGSGPPIPGSPNLAATGYLLIDARNSEILVEYNADEPLPPASLASRINHLGTRPISLHQLYLALREPDWEEQYLESMLNLQP